MANSFAVLTICGLAIAAGGTLLGIRKTIPLGGLLLVGFAAPGYTLFWLVFLSPRVGHYAAVAWFFLSVIAFAMAWRRMDADARRALRTLAAPVLLTGAAALWIYSFGHLYGGRQDPLSYARTRFSHGLPPDNELPFIFAEALKQGHIPRPFFADWLSSDRPPLQTGITLAHFPFWRRPWNNSYQALGVLLQSLWVIGLWLLLEALGVCHAAKALALTACLFSGFVLWNSFYVWPKLLAAAFGLAFLAVMWNGARHWAIGGCLLAFAFLSHGGAAFSAMVFIPLLAWRSGGRKWVAAALAVSAAVYLPWSLYQKWVDPPGNALLKMHLAGIEKRDDRPFVQGLLDQYRTLTPARWLDGKLANFRMNTGETAHYWHDAVALAAGPNRSEAANDMRIQCFFHNSCALGIFAFGPLFLLAGWAGRFRTREWRAAWRLWLWAGICLVVWCLLMFVPGATSVHQGSYAMNLLALAGSVLAFWAISPRLAVACSALQIAINFLVYAVFPRIDGVARPGTLVLSLLSLAAVIGVLWRSAHAAGQREPAGA